MTDTKKIFKGQVITDPELARRVSYIESLDYQDMAILRRFSPIGHPFFVEGSMENTVFETRFRKLGGGSPKISKAIGLADTRHVQKIVEDSLRLYPDWTPLECHEEEREL